MSRKVASQRLPPQADRVVVMIGEAIDTGAGCGEQIARGDARPGWRRHIADRARTDDQRLRRGALYPFAKNPEVAAISLRIISRRCTVRRGECWLVHEFHRRDVATQRTRRVDQALRLIHLPHAVRITAAGTDREGGDDFCVDRARKIDDATPLIAAEHGVESRRWLVRRTVRVGKERRICPGAAHAHISRR